MSYAELRKGCRSYRRFQQEPVPQEILREIMEDVRSASSAANQQTLRFEVISQPDLVRTMQPLVRWAGALPKELGTPKEGEQPTAWVLILEPEKTGAFTGVDEGIAVDTLVMSAWEKGIGSCIMGAIDRDGIAKEIGIPYGYIVKLAVALGKPTHTSEIVEVPQNGNLAYYLDDDRNYYVPKLPLEDLVEFR